MIALTNGSIKIKNIRTQPNIIYNRNIVVQTNRLKQNRLRGLPLLSDRRRLWAVGSLQLFEPCGKQIHNMPP